MSQNEKQREIEFLDIIFFFLNVALAGLGETEDPRTGKKEKNLELAKQNIDIIAKLKEKTKGNLTQEEERIIDDILYNLRMKFIEAIKK
jgi:hypothetical protein